LQRDLGNINDTVTVTVTATALAERLVGEARLDLAPAIGALAERLERRRNDALGDLARRWKAFAEQPRFWE
jgi:hypothetical protein